MNVNWELFIWTPLYYLVKEIKGFQPLYRKYSVVEYE